MTLLTIGYEGIDIASFLAALKAHRVERLIDVRELPLSRKKGFSKTALTHAAESAGIAYQHISALGCPREIRRDYYADRNWTRYKKRFEAYLVEQDEILASLLKVAQSERCCLVCFEADYTHCHRSIISDALTRTSKIEVDHLAFKGPKIAVDLRQVAA